jgi:hypothetical protein
LRILKEQATNDIYAMQRANGDWFALDHRGDFRVPIFRSQTAAMQARQSNGEMLLFHPVMLDESALISLAPTSEPDHFWLVDLASVNLRRGQRLDQSQLAALIQNAN